MRLEVQPAVCGRELAPVGPLHLDTGRVVEVRVGPPPGHVGGHGVGPQARVHRLRAERARHHGVLVEVQREVPVVRTQIAVASQITGAVHATPGDVREAVEHVQASGAQAQRAGPCPELVQVGFDGRAGRQLCLVQPERDGLAAVQADAACPQVAGEVTGELLPGVEDLPVHGEFPVGAVQDRAAHGVVGQDVDPLADRLPAQVDLAQRGGVPAEIAQVVLGLREPQSGPEEVRSEHPGLDSGFHVSEVRHVPLVVLGEVPAVRRDVVLGLDHVAGLDGTADSVDAHHPVHEAEFTAGQPGHPGQFAADLELLTQHGVVALGHMSDVHLVQQRGLVGRPAPAERPRGVSLPVGTERRAGLLDDPEAHVADLRDGQFVRVDQNVGDDEGPGHQADVDDVDLVADPARGRVDLAAHLGRGGQPLDGLVCGVRQAQVEARVQPVHLECLHGTLRDQRSRHHRVADEVAAEVPLLRVEALDRRAGAEAVRAAGEVHTRHLVHHEEPGGVQPQRVVGARLLLIAGAEHLREAAFGELGDVVAVQLRAVRPGQRFEGGDPRRTA